MEGLELGPMLARGSFGEVFRGRFNGKKVAVKVRRPANRRKTAAAPQQGSIGLLLCTFSSVLCTALPIKLGLQACNHILQIWFSTVSRSCVYLQVCTGNLRSTKGKTIKPWKNMEALQVREQPQP